MENTSKSSKAKTSSFFLVILLLCMFAAIAFLGYNFFEQQSSIEALSPIASSATADPVRAYVKVGNSIVETRTIKGGEEYILIGIPLGETSVSEGATLVSEGSSFILKVDKGFAHSNVSIKFLGGTVYLPVQK